MFKRIWNIVSTAILAVVLVIALSLGAAKIFGAGSFAVLSGSMEPSYPVGSLIYTQKVDPQELKVGDPITFTVAEDTVVTHRIVELQNNEENGLSFVTKGDANEFNDANPVNHRNVIGKPIFSLPFLGYAISYIQTPQGRYAMIAAIAALLLITLLPDLLKGNEKDPAKE